MQIGLEVCLAQPPAALRGARFGLLANQASVDTGFRYAWDLLAEAFPGQLAALFSPQHGLWGEEQANMIETPHGRHPRLRVPVYSLYSETRRPTPEMLEALDCVVIDLQDVGTRVYTFAWTVCGCLEACAEANIPVLILDRPNPLGGVIVEGPLLNPVYASFVGRAAVPMRHGLTLAELALFANDTLNIGAEVHVVPMEGYCRRMMFAKTGRAWIAPSPNLARLEAMLLYAGQVLLEGTQVSEGRGTTTPFEVVGAPFIDPDTLPEALSALDLPGVRFRPVRFRPTFDKWAGESCGGVCLHVTDPFIFQPYRTTVCLLATIRLLWPDHFQWLSPPYEYETEKMPIDILSGDSLLREAVTAEDCDAGSLEQLCNVDAASWERRTRAYRLYGE